MCITEALREQVKKFQQSTGERAMMIVVEKRDSSMGVHSVEFSPYVGLMVDGKPPGPQWYQEVESFHQLQWGPPVLH
ncbi:MAG: hypothetical protein Q8S92_15995 [Hydrogenophaga sp.]|jgi:hypothetical protein|uniref:hypothetical protein n=1 Tax=Hydrogenophaga sp. TaxID=1904254 RepID=UPI002735BCA7|nr:hypothetical protein [Hydrogenophaga sp.]MDP3350493.1 hypothetical protein [Hydrogenophaga sp.]